MKKISSFSNANIALVKYWGKSDSLLNIPIVPSLSMTLDKLGSFTTITRSQNKDRLILNGIERKDDSLFRLKSFLDYVRKSFFCKEFFLVESQNNIPTAAGVASSSCAYASIACAINEYLSLKLDEKDLSKLARVGSASAARSIFGDIVGLYGGENLSHDDSFAFPIKADVADWRLIIILLSSQEKKISSRKAMSDSMTSPFFQSFVKESQQDFSKGITAIKKADLVEIGKIMEHSTLKMHACMWTAKPSINYFKPESLALIEKVYDLREKLGPIAFFTLDAGPNVKILCQEENLEKIIHELHLGSADYKFLVSKPGEGVKIVSENKYV